MISAQSDPYIPSRTNSYLPNQTNPVPAGNLSTVLKLILSLLAMTPAAQAYREEQLRIADQAAQMNPELTGIQNTYFKKTKSSTKRSQACTFDKRRR